MSINQAVILAGGLGSRLGNLVKKTPKPMLKFQNKPFLSYLIDHLKNNKISEIIILAGYKGKVIKKCTQKYKNVSLIIEKTPLGTGGALISSLKLCKKKFIFLNGDSFLNIILENKILKYSKIKKNIFFLVKNIQHKHNKKLSNLSLNRRKEVIIKNKSNLMYSGVSILYKKDLKGLRLKKNYSFENDIVPNLIKKKKVLGEFSSEFFLDVGTKNNYKFAQKYFKSKIKNKCFFFDRDNTLINDEGYTFKKKDLKWKPGAIKAINFLNKLNYLVIIITNQSGVARGLYSEKDVIKFHDHMNAQLKKKMCKINDFYYCPYHTKGKGKYKKNSFDRKPKNGMILKAVKKWNIDVSKSFLIGDSDVDKIAAKKSNIAFYKAENNLLTLTKKIISNVNK